MPAAPHTSHSSQLHPPSFCGEANHGGGDFHRGISTCSISHLAFLRSSRRQGVRDEIKTRKNLCVPCRKRYLIPKKISVTIIVISHTERPALLFCFDFTLLIRQINSTTFDSPSRFSIFGRYFKYETVETVTWSRSHPILTFGLTDNICEKIAW